MKEVALSAARIGVVAVVLVALPGCGIRWSDDQRQSVLAEQGGGAQGAAAQAAAPVEATPEVAASPSTSVAAAGGSAAPAVTSAAPRAAGSSPCAQPSTEVGVTKDTITLGAIGTLSGPVPGLSKTMLAGAKAYVAYRNATGGVCGRKLVLRTADDGGDNGQYRSAASEMIRTTLGLAGGFAIGDGGGADVIRSANVPVLGLSASDPMAAVPNVFSMVPHYPDVHRSIAKYRYLFEHGARKVALVYTAAEAARSQVQGQERPLLEAAGMKVVTTQEVPVSSLSFDSTARAVANSGADYLIFLSASTYSASMARSMADTGYKLKFAEYIAMYGSNFPELAGAAGEGAISWSQTYPDEDPATTPEQVAYRRWFARAGSGAKPDTFSAAAWSATKAFVDALEHLPGPITRPAVLAGVRAIHSYEAGGMLGRIDLGAKANLGCQAAMQVKGGKWTRLAPANGFMC